MDLVVPPGPGVPQGLTVPASDLVERFSRSSGPGGQGVNTADSRVELELAEARRRLAEQGSARPTDDELRAEVRRLLSNHRLVTLTGFGGGLATKRFLLALEAGSAPTSADEHDVLA